ncbi:MAG: minor capsid protein [Candidatus Kapabacteria bacterium]|nr:minor capsid protein [Candidatus Kapabacteria bacterium]
MPLNPRSPAMPLDLKILVRALRMTDDKALAYLKRKEPTLTWSSEKFAELADEVRARSFTMAKVMQLDILQDVHDVLVKASEEGLTFEEFKKQVTTRLEPKGWYVKKPSPSETANEVTPWRLKTVYRTNIQSSYAAGRYKRQMEVINRRPYLRFDAVIDVNTTAGCADLNGTILHHDDPFWANNYPPRHYNCRSSVTTLNEYEMKRDGYTLTESESVKDVLPAKGFMGTPDGSYFPDRRNYKKKLYDEFEDSLP